MPSDIKTWIKQLSEKPLPIMSATRNHLRELMANENLSISNYAGPVLHDPCLSVILLRSINKSKAAQGREMISTMSNVMPHMGPAQIKKQLNQALLLEDLKLPERQQQGYLRYVSQACHAAYQSSYLAQARHVLEPEEMQLAALLQNFTELALWCYGGNVMPEIEQQVYIHKKTYSLACKEVLGCDIRVLAVALAKAWNLPELVIEGLGSKGSGFTLAVAVMLSSQLARLSSISWYDKAALSCIQAIADYQGVSISEVEHQLHQNAVDFTDYLPQFSGFSAARLLPMLVDEKYIDLSFSLVIENEKKAALKKEKQSNTAGLPEEKQAKSQVKTEKSQLADKIRQKLATKSAATVAKKEPQKTPAKSINRGLKQNKSTPVMQLPAEAPAQQEAGTGEKINLHELLMSQAKQVAILHDLIDSKSSVTDIIQQAVNTCKVHGFKRVMFAIKVAKKDALMARFFGQDESGHALKPFTIVLDKPHVFKLLMTKPQSIWLQDKNKAKYWGLIPANVKLALHNDQFFAMSVFANSKPVGIMYADKPKGKLTQVEYKSFKGVCDILSKGLVSVLKKS